MQQQLPTPFGTKATPEELEAKKQRLMADLKARKPRTVTKTFWQDLGFDIPRVDSLEEARALADQGLPCYVQAGSFWTFSPEVLVKEAEEAFAEIKAEFALSEEEREKTPNRLKSVSEMLKTPRNRLVGRRQDSPFRTVSNLRSVLHR